MKLINQNIFQKAMLLTFLTALISYRLVAQDHFFSQYNNTPQFVNPALLVKDYQVRFNFHHRYQAVDSRASFFTNALSLNWPLLRKVSPPETVTKRQGQSDTTISQSNQDNTGKKQPDKKDTMIPKNWANIGVTVFNDQIPFDQTSVGTTGLMIGFVKKSNLDVKEKITLGWGGQLAHFGRRLVNENFTTDNQFKAGFFDDTILPESISGLNNEGVTKYWTFGLGAFLEHKGENTNGYEQDWYIGLAVNNLTLSKTGVDLNKLSTLWNFNAGWRHKRDKRSYEPSVRIMKRDQLFYTTLGGKVTFDDTMGESNVSLGLWLNTIAEPNEPVAVVNSTFSTEIQWKKWLLGISYDIPFQSRKRPTIGNGIIELSVGLVIDKRLSIDWSKVSFTKQDSLIVADVISQSDAERIKAIGSECIKTKKLIQIMISDMIDTSKRLASRSFARKVKRLLIVEGVKNRFLKIGEKPMTDPSKIHIEVEVK